MWNTIPLVTSSLALAAFVVAATVEIMRRILRSRERQIAQAPERDRLAMAQALNDSFLVLGKPINTTKLTKEQQYSIIITQIRDRARRFYMIAATLIVIALCSLMAFAANRIFINPPIIGGERERSISKTLWKQFYSQDFQAIYESLPEEIKSQARYADVLREFKRQVAQFPSAPVARRFDREGPVAGLWSVSFLAEFDAASTFREVTRFTHDASGLQPFQMEIVPIGWPTTLTSRFLTQNPSQIVRSLSAVAPDALKSRVGNQLKDYLIPVPGWTVVVDRMARRVGDATCDLETHDQESGTKVMLMALLGGCDLASGEALTILGRLSDADAGQIQISDVRFLR